jgi:hypothetical protein
MAGRADAQHSPLHLTRRRQRLSKRPSPPQRRAGFDSRPPKIQPGEGTLCPAAAQRKREAAHGLFCRIARKCVHGPARRTARSKAGHLSVRTSRPKFQQLLFWYLNAKRRGHVGWGTATNVWPHDLIGDSLEDYGGERPKRPVQSGSVGRIYLICIERSHRGSPYPAFSGAIQART